MAPGGIARFHIYNLGSLTSLQGWLKTCLALICLHLIIWLVAIRSLPLEPEFSEPASFFQTGC